MKFNHDSKLTHSSQLFHNKCFSKPHHSLITIISILKQLLSRTCESADLLSNTRGILNGQKHTPETATESGLNKIHLFHYLLLSNYSVFSDSSL